MATWEDGPEYAPLERPSGFDPSGLEPLGGTRPFVEPVPNAPAERPRFDGPPVTLAPLAALVPADDSPRRDPNEPFDVAGSTLTETSSAWSAARGAAVGAPGPGARTPGGSVPSAPIPGAVQNSPVQPNWGPPGGEPARALAPGAWPAADQPMVLSSGPAVSQNGFAAPGSNGWFGAPPPQLPAPYGSPAVSAGEVLRAMTPGLAIVLGLGILLGVVTSITPLTYAIAWVLAATRVRVARRQVLRSFLVGLIVAVLLWLISLATSNGYLTGFEILSRCLLAVSIAQLVSVAVLVTLGLRRGELPAPPPGRGPYPPNSPWG